jgi:hypothetical protein
LTLLLGAALVLALYHVPFAGLTFLWFIGAVRDRIGAADDRFFATVFPSWGLTLSIHLLLHPPAARAASGSP